MYLSGSQCVHGLGFNPQKHQKQKQTNKNPFHLNPISSSFVLHKDLSLFSSMQHVGICQLKSPLTSASLTGQDEHNISPGRKSGHDRALKEQLGFCQRKTRHVRPLRRMCDAN